MKFYNHLMRSCAPIALGSAVVLGAWSLAYTQDSVTLAHPAPQGHVFDTVGEAFMASLEANDSADIGIDWHPGGDLGDWTSQFEQTMAGAIEMTMTFAASQFDPKLDVAIMGFVVEDWDDAAQMYGPDGAMRDIYSDLFEALNLKLLDVVPIDFVGYAIRQGVGSVPTDLPAEAEGLQIRVPPQAVAVRRFEALGFSPVPMPYSELYTALQLGTVDGRAFGPPVEIAAMADVLETYIFSKDYFEHGFWVANLDWWNGLSDAERAAMEEAVADARDVAWDQAKALSDEQLQIAIDAGVEVVEFTDEERAQVRTLIIENEWPFLEERVGSVLVDRVRQAAGIQ